MGLIAGEARLDKTHVQALREVEAAQLLAGRLVAGAEAGAQQQAAAGAGAGAGAAPRQRYNELLDFGA